MKKALLFMLLLCCSLFSCSSDETFDSDVINNRNDRSVFEPRDDISSLYAGNPLLSAQNEFIENGNKIDVNNHITGYDYYLWLYKDTAKTLTYFDFKQFFDLNSAAKTLSDYIYVWFEDFSCLVFNADATTIFYCDQPAGFPNKTICGYASLNSDDKYIYTPIIDPELTGYPEGQYKVGTDIPSGQYVLYPLDYMGDAYYSYSSDANGKEIINNDFFSGNSLIEVFNGEFLELSNCVAHPLGEAPVRSLNPFGELSDGFYIVGVDIPAGEYKLFADATSNGYYCIYTDLRRSYIKSNDNFDSSRYISVSRGDYLLLSRCHTTVDLSLSPDGTTTYKVGSDIAPGLYIIVPKQREKVCYYACDFDLTSLSNLEFPGIFNIYNLPTDRFFFIGNALIELKENEYLRTIDSYLLPIDEYNLTVPNQKHYTEGEYLVGYDIPPGVYKLQEDYALEKCVYYIRDDLSKMITEYSFSSDDSNSNTIALSEGQSIAIIFGSIELINE